MKKTLPNHTSKFMQRTSWLGVVLLFTIMFASHAVGGPDGKQPRILSEDGKLKKADPVVNATIEKKGSHRVVTTTGVSYAITKETIIVGPDGSQVSLKALSVPSDVRIRYKIVNGAYKAWRINIISTSARASTEFFEVLE